VIYAEDYLKIPGKDIIVNYAKNIFMSAITVKIEFLNVLIAAYYWQKKVLLINTSRKLNQIIKKVG
jgi:hypothetical protein